MKRIPALLALCLLGGCASGTLYEWGSYSQDLLVYAKNPQGAKEFSERLRRNITAAERKGKVPPGMYAELGYVMVELGDDREAIQWFQKEQDKWPESASLMSGIIKRLSRPVGDSVGGAKE